MSDARGGMLRLNSVRRVVESVLLSVLRYCHQDPGRGLFTVPDVEQLLKYRVVVATCGMAGVLATVGVPPGHFTHIMYARTQPCALCALWPAAPRVCLTRAELQLR